MELCNETLTVANVTIDAATGREVYHYTELTRCGWVHRRRVSASAGSLISADEAVIRIPADATPRVWTPPGGYSGGETWTLAEGDTIIRGKVANTALRPAEISAEKAVVCGYTDNRRGRAPHWKVVAE